ncbi:hypothetical protein MtrunA17_Chr8g0345521 [Medicago truncatula]|uniref:Transmembrane protein, putative n=1 Tax=Medicago truncatula TaxID=3880 RepID=G7L9Y9_MEDTR|nr:transmembrane protein, putative [Medicago truncatula]AFK44963.1 unknown [Medicago truncatula]RHN39595.1 hypothetical protein MtrunA17_Chr8g0345521 [Medicago truncatula]
MSSQFILESVIGALLKNLWIFSVSYLLLTLSVFCSSLYMLFVNKSKFFVIPSVSMRLRPKRTCYRVVCFGGFHIQKFSNLFLFLRVDLT